MENPYEKYTSELDEYIAKTRSRLSALLSALEWNEVDTLKDSTCYGDLKDDEQRDDPCDPLLPESFESKHSIVIGEEKLKEILDSNAVVVPKRFSDIQANFTREQKLALYDYVVLNTGKISEPELKVSIPGGNQGPNDMTFAEIVAKEKKKEKTLRRKYRTSKPTHIEEVRNLVHLQMQALVQYFHPKSPERERDPRPGCSRPRKRKRSHSRDRKRSKHKRKRSRKRDSSSERYSRSHHSKKKSKKRSRSRHKSSKKHKRHHKSKTTSD